MLIRLLSQIILAVICFFVLISCTSQYQPEQVLVAYANSLARSQYVSISVPAFVSPALYPPLQLRQQALTRFDVSILDFMSLQQCDVGFFVGKKNSVLGRVMPNSQRFLYEINIIRGIESCHINNKSLAKKLHCIALIKRKKLPIAFTNAVFSGDEGRDYFSLSNGFVPMANGAENYQQLFFFTAAHQKHWSEFVVIA